ncbi:MAG TPA: hypothetical protein DCE18_07990, partial [Syntrophobacteraceae bacterium]|nr:hypothetical protein [Syntrophobacteraceae bacterium]
MKSVFMPRSLDALWQCLEEAPNALLYAGGTDALVKVRKGLADAPTLVCLERLQELRGVQDRGDSIRIGAITTLRHILEHPLVREHLGVLHQAIHQLGSPPIRAMG